MMAGRIRGMSKLEQHPEPVETEQNQQEEPMEDRIATLTAQAQDLYDHTLARLEEMRAERRERERSEADMPDPITN